MSRVVVAKVKIGSVTSGYDANADETIVTSWYVAAFAPDFAEIEQSIQDKIKAVISYSLYLGVDAFYATPGEIGLRLAAAYGAFKGALVAGLKLSGLLEVVEGKLDDVSIDLASVTEREPGLHLILQVENPLVKTFGYIQEWVSQQTGGDLAQLVGAALRLSVGAAGLLSINIDVRLDNIQLPTPDQAAEYVKELLRRAKEQAAKIPVVGILALGVDSALSEFDEAREQIDETARDFLNKPVDTVLQRPGEVIDAMKAVSEASVSAAVAVTGATVQAVGEAATQAVNAVLNAVGVPAPHVDLGTPHIDVAPLHVDIGTPHIDVAPPHVDIGTPHIDVAPPHVDIGTPHIDLPPAPHIDLPPAPHVDLPPAPHVDIGHIDLF